MYSASFLADRPTPKDYYAYDGARCSDAPPPAPMLPVATLDDHPECPHPTLSPTNPVDPPPTPPPTPLSRQRELRTSLGLADPLGFQYSLLFEPRKHPTLYSPLCTLSV